MHHSHFNFDFALSDGHVLISPTYDIPLVILSVLIAISSSFIAFFITQKVSHAEFKKEANVWRACAALFLGVGIWAMHFVGMLAYQFDIPVSYNITVTFVSIIPAILASFLVVSSQQLSWIPFSVRSIFMGIGIGSMHYAGMMAMEMNAVMFYDSGLFILSIVVAVLLSGVALKVNESHLNRTVSIFSIYTLYASIIMGLAISGMHYIGMYSMSIVDTGMSHFEITDPSHGVLVKMIALVITVSTILLLGLLAYRSRVLSIQRMDKILAAVQEGFINFRSNGEVIYMNPAAQKLFGIASKDLTSTFISDLITNSAGNAYAALNSITLLIENGATKQITERLKGKRKDGTLFPISVTFTISDKEERSFVCTIRDLSDLSRQEVFTQNVFDNLPLGVIVKNSADLTIIHVNTAAQNIIGKKEVDIVGLTDFDIFDKDDASKITESDVNVINNLKPITISDEKINIDNVARYFNIRKTPIFDAEGSYPRFLLTIIEDTTDLVETRRELEHAHSRMAMASDAAKIGFWEWNNDTQSLYWDERMHHIYGVSRDSELSNFAKFKEIVHPDDYSALIRVFLNALNENTTFHKEFRAITPNNQIRYVKVDGASDGKRMFGIKMDITERVLAEKETQRLSLTDVLTGLGNRAALEKFFNNEIVRNKRKGTFLYCVYMDLNKFKPINDTYGHHVGDEVLVEIGRRLSNSVRETDCATRAGGDEFVIMLTELTNEYDAKQLISRLYKDITLPIKCSVGDLEVGASVGVSYYPVNGDTLDELLNAADKKMYEQKKR